MFEFNIPSYFLFSTDFSANAFWSDKKIIEKALLLKLNETVSTLKIETFLCHTQEESK